MPRNGLAALLFLVAWVCPSLAQDIRELVRLPEPMQDHMLGNMRDHLATLNEIIGDVADSKFDEAAKIAEQHLGMSSLTAHDAAHMAPFFPKPMQDMGSSMHHAASRLVIVLQDASDPEIARHSCDAAQPSMPTGRGGSFAKNAKK